MSLAIFYVKTHLSHQSKRFVSVWLTELPVLLHVQILASLTSNWLKLETN